MQLNTWKNESPQSSLTVFAWIWGVVFPKSLWPRGANLGSGLVGCKFPLWEKGRFSGVMEQNMDDKLWGSQLTHSLGSMGTKVGGYLSRVWLTSLRLKLPCLTEKLEFFFVSFFNMNVWMWLRSVKTPPSTSVSPSHTFTRSPASSVG